MSNDITEVFRLKGIHRLTGSKISTIIPLPQRGFEPENTFMHTIEVNPMRQSIVKMADILRDRVAIENGDDQPLIDYGRPESGRTFQLKIEVRWFGSTSFYITKLILWIKWPGYSGRTAFIDMKGGLITRFELFKAIAEQFYRFINVNNDRINYNKGDAIPYYHIGMRGITFDNLYHVAIHNISGDIWMAEVSFTYSDKTTL